MKLYRIARAEFASDLSGRGGLLSPARWHNFMPVLYTSVQSSTCILEKLVHLEPDEIHHDLEMVEILVPDAASFLSVAVEDLPVNWSNYPAPRVLEKIGNTWLSSMRSLLLYVPSVCDPFSKNVLVNPAHEEAAALKILSISPFRFDKRLYNIKAKKP